MIPFPNISSELFSITILGTEFALRWYALAYIAGLLLGWRLVVLALRREVLWGNYPIPMQAKQVDDLLTWIILGVILGGRLGFVLFYNPSYYAKNPAEILQVWQGGMSFHGGLLGVAAAAFIFFRKYHVPLMSGADLLALAAPPGLLLGRVANFINAELWGRSTDMPWGVAFPGYMAQDCGQITGLCARHPSQLYEAVLEGMILGAVLIWLVWRRNALARPGTCVGIFFLGYGIARFMVEFVRQPDAQFITVANPLGLAWQINGYGLTMGQFLSLPMIIIGLLLLAIMRRRHIKMQIT